MALDIGANIGQMTSLMRHLAGPNGQVISFEPHPDIFNELQDNIRMDPDQHLIAPAVLNQLALSDHSGTAIFETGEIFQSNRGTARLTSVDKPPPGTTLRSADLPP